MHTDVACIPVTYATNNTLNLPDVAAAADAALRTVPATGSDGRR